MRRSSPRQTAAPPSTTSDEPLGDHRLTFAAQAWIAFKKEFETTPVQLIIAVLGLFATIYSIAAPFVVFQQGSHRTSNFTADVNISQLGIIIGLVAVAFCQIIIATIQSVLQRWLFSYGSGVGYVRGSSRCPRFINI